MSIGSLQGRTQYSKTLLLRWLYRSDGGGLVDSKVHSGSLGSSLESPESDMMAGESGLDTWRRERKGRKLIPVFKYKIHFSY